MDWLAGLLRSSAGLGIQQRYAWLKPSLRATEPSRRLSTKSRNKRGATRFSFMHTPVGIPSGPAAESRKLSNTFWDSLSIYIYIYIWVPPPGAPLVFRLYTYREWEQVIETLWKYKYIYIYTCTYIYIYICIHLFASKMFIYLLKNTSQTIIFDWVSWLLITTNSPNRYGGATQRSTRIHHFVLQIWFFINLRDSHPEEYTNTSFCCSDLIFYQIERPPRRVHEYIILVFKFDLVQPAQTILFALLSWLWITKKNKPLYLLDFPDFW